MARSSRVLIQGGNVPGGFVEVVGPVDHTFATDFAKATYDYPGAQYIWVRSWGEDEDEKGNKLNRNRPQNPQDAQAMNELSSALFKLFLILISLWLAFVTFALE